jgi:hypothetical protein
VFGDALCHAEIGFADAHDVGQENHTRPWAAAARWREEEGLCRAVRSTNLDLGLAHALLLFVDTE